MGDSMIGESLLRMIGALTTGVVLTLGIIFANHMVKKLRGGSE